MAAFLVSTVAALILSSSVDAAESKGPKVCNGIIMDKGPTLEQLRRKFLGPDAPPVTFAEPTSRSFPGAEFVIASPTGPARLRLPDYPGALFAWDSANDSLVMQISRELEPFRTRGQLVVPARNLTGSIMEREKGTAILVIDGVDLTEGPGEESVE
jgi:hypothetical protein